MVSVTVLLRPWDERSLQLIGDYLAEHGLLVGQRTNSQIIRFALGYAAEIIARGNRGENETGDGDGTGSDTGRTPVTGDPPAPDTGTAAGQPAVGMGHKFRPGNRPR